MGASDKQAFYAPRRGVIATLVYLVTYSVVLLFARLVSGLRVVGRDNIKHVRGGGFVVSNHVLYLDPALICVALFPRRLYFSALEETFGIPIIGSYIRMLGAFPVSGRMSGSTLVRNTLAMIREGRLVHFFPEGNLLHLSHTLQDFKPGVFGLAVLFNKPIIPLTITTVKRKFFGDALNEYACKVVISIGKPIYPNEFDGEGKGRKKAAERMSTFLHTTMQTELDSMSRRA
jgi:1,2-diacylglycerol 3-alpha-glucosyltransferase